MTKDRAKLQKVILATVQEIKTTPSENVQRFFILRKRLIKYARRFKATLTPEELAQATPETRKLFEMIEGTADKHE